jgi:hypothetical protein
VVGSADEITDYVARFDAEAAPDRQHAVQQVDQLLTSMAPLDCLVAMAKAVRRLKEQTLCTEPGLIEEVCRHFAAFVRDSGDGVRSNAARP